MATRRQRRINELLMQELSTLLPGRVDDPRLVTIVVTRVESTQDLATAKTYFTTSAAASEEELAVIHEALEQARGFLRGQLAHLGLRRIPKLVFARDRDFESGHRVLDLLEKLSEERGEPADQDEVSSDVVSAAEPHTDASQDDAGEHAGADPSPSNQPHNGLEDDLRSDDEHDAVADGADGPTDAVLGPE